MPSQSAADKVFRFLEGARNLKSLTTLDAAFFRLIEDWGFDRWTATPILSPVRGAMRPLEVVLGRPSREWSSRYRENGYFRHDAVINHIANSSDAVWWSRFSQERRLSHEEKMLFDEAREHGVGEGLTAPVRLADGSIWACALTGSLAKPAPHVADAARFAAERYILTALELRRLAEPESIGASITPAQADIVDLLARGLTLRQAAQALDIRPSTAYNQIADAKRRAMVKTTAELVHKTSGKARSERPEKTVRKPS
ncbi:MAG: N-acyl homoserine lactone transcriptional regulator, LuxR-like protein [Alphaproteobacteria bacterium]|nr:MAG: N-acyl homoserine lactone transcriptional regulator LuxR-like protein [Caulobacteraceae bacterium]TPW06399.1 MAG: N-acyl homoserine lactone transcriptional regulator, LuxR-like protein [Alphaproteobacteria bacterium]